MLFKGCKCISQLAQNIIVKEVIKKLHSRKWPPFGSPDTTPPHAEERNALIHIHMQLHMADWCCWCWHICALGQELLHSHWLLLYPSPANISQHHPAYQWTRQATDRGGGRRDEGPACLHSFELRKANCQNTPHQYLLWYLCIKFITLIARCLLLLRTDLSWVSCETLCIFVITDKCILINECMKTKLLKWKHFYVFGFFH